MTFISPDNILPDPDSSASVRSEAVVPYRISPYVHFIENRLSPNAIQYGIFHQLTGVVFELRERVRALLHAAKLGNRISLNENDLRNLAEDGAQLKELIESEFLIRDGCDPLLPFADQYVVRPIQNPAVSYRSDSGEISLVRTSMKHSVYSPKRDELPAIIEERMPGTVAEIFLLADGTKTLHDIFESVGANCANVLEAHDLQDAVEFLTDPDRQLIKFTARPDDLGDPYKPFNTVPRNLYHSSRWDGKSLKASTEPMIDFHLHGIEDAGWEFDLIEPTVNHSFRFPNQALGGLDYGSRFCLSTLRLEVLPSLAQSDRLEVLEVGGGTGAFARAFIERAHSLRATTLAGIKLNYHIVDLSPALIESQKKLLAPLLKATQHFQQDATELNLPGHRFDLIIANEVLADFPVASVRYSRGSQPTDIDGNLTSGDGPRCDGDGAYYVEKYGLADETTPDRFLVNAGAFRFIERAWEHLSPGGALVITEYGAAQRYPAQAYHLNHEEFSIHFGHVAACANKVGFDCRLLTLKDFLALDDQVPVLNGREEHILCLNHVLRKYGMLLPYAVLSELEFEERFRELAQQIDLTGFSFSPLWRGYHFGPRIDDFMVLIMNKPL